MSTNQYDVESDEEVVIAVESDEENSKAMEIESPVEYNVEKKSTEYFIQVIEEPDALFEAVQLNLWLINEVTFKNIKTCLDQRGYAKVLQVFKTEELHMINHTFADIEWLGFGDVELRNLDNIIEGRLLNGMKIHDTEGDKIIKEIDKNLDIQPQCFQNSFSNPTFYNSTCQTLFRSQSFSEFNTNKSDIKILQRSLSNIDIITDNNNNNMDCEGLSLPLLPPYDTMNYPPPFTYQYIRYSSCVGKMTNNNENNNNNINQNNNVHIERPIIVVQNNHPPVDEEIIQPLVNKPTVMELLSTNEKTSGISENKDKDSSNTPPDGEKTETTDFLDNLLDHEEDFEFD